MNSDSSTGIAIQVVAGAIGSCWGYPGMMIGLAVGAFIAGQVAGKHSSNNNSDIKNLNYMTRIDTVPYVIGTAMCPGQLVWFGQMSLLDSAALTADYAYDSDSSYFSTYYRPMASKFAVAFCSSFSDSTFSTGGFYSNNGPKINRVFFDGKDKWEWGLWLTDIIKWNSGSFATPFNTNLKCNTNQTFNGSKDYLLNGIPHKHFTWMSYDGWFGDYSALELLSPNQLSRALRGRDPYSNSKRFSLNKFITLQRFPDITSEISSQSMYSHEGFSSANLYTSYQNNSRYPTNVNIPDNRISCRDGLHDYYYTFTSVTDYYTYTHYKLNRIHPVYGWTEVFPYPGTDYTLGYNHKMDLSRTDEWLDRIYFFKGRLHTGNHTNWSKQDTSYAKYSLAYDLFYVDRATLLPHSLKVNEILYLGDFEAPANTIQINSIEITPDRILAFGWMTQDAFPVWHEIKITAVGNDGTRIYADMSGIPDGTFDDYYCCNLGGSGSKHGPFRKIRNQTTTYIDIETYDGRSRSFGTRSTDLVGQILRISFALTEEMEYVTADIGSTTTEIICNCPFSFFNTDGATDLEIGQFWSIWPAYSNYNYTYRIDWTRTGFGETIYLLDPLPTAPLPGDIFFVGNDGFYPSPQTPLNRQMISPIIPSRMQSRYDWMKQMPWWWDNSTWITHFGTPTTDPGVGHDLVWRWQHVEGGPWINANKFVVLQFDKETGAFLGLLNEASTYVRSAHAWGDAIQYTTDPDSTIITCATDKEIFVHICCMQDATNGAACDFTINSETLAVSGRGWAENPFGGGHAAGTFPVATAWLSVYNPDTRLLEKTWYSLWYSYAGKWKSTITLINGVYVQGRTFVNNYSIFFAKLNAGTFNTRTLQKIFSRRVLYSGPLYVLWWQGGAYTESRFIAKMSLENKLFIYLNHAWDGGNYSFGGYSETWIFEGPYDGKPQGSFRCIDQTGNDWISVSSGWALNILGFNNFTSTISTVIAGSSAYQGGVHADSYHCDANPIFAIYNFLYYSGSIFGGWFNQDYDHPFSFNSYGEEITSLFYDTYYSYYTNTTPSTWVQVYHPYTYTDARNICHQAVIAQVIINDQLVYYLEPRYQYSECMTTPKQFFQAAKDIMQSCMGWITFCQGRIRFVVPKKGERAEYYFGTEETGRVFVGTQDSPYWVYSTTYRGGEDENDWGMIYIDVSDYPINYFKGETGSFTLNNIFYEFSVISNLWPNKIRIGIYNPSSLPPSWGYQSIPFAGIQFTIHRKDNIKEGSFVYGQKSKMSTQNITRIEFEDRTKNYITEISEVTSEALRQSDGYNKIQTYSFKGIKRATQAARVSQQLQDYLEFVEWTCGFETDIMGMYLCPGVIIGISHAVTGWVNKLFRIMSLEESGGDFNMKLELEEYVPDVYHDFGAPVIISGTGSGGATSGWGATSFPLNNFSLLEDQTMPYLWVGFNSSGFQTNLIGANVLRLNGAIWELVGTVIGVPITMELNLPLTDSKFDNQFISYTNPQGGTIPLSGYVWIGAELIGYNGVDTVNSKLMNLVRGVNDTPIGSHDELDLITVFGTAPYIEFPCDWVGLQTFLVTPIVYGVVSTGDESDAPEFPMIIVGYACKPHPPESLRLVEE